MFSALPLRADIAQQTRHVRFVPKPEVARSLRRHWHGKKTAGFQTNVPVHPGARRSRRGRRGPAVNQNENGRNTLVKGKCCLIPKLRKTLKIERLSSGGRSRGSCGRYRP